jgi:hypothetical protein
MGRPLAYVTTPFMVIPAIPCLDWDSKTLTERVCLFPLYIGSLREKTVTSVFGVTCFSDELRRVEYASSGTLDKTNTDNNGRITKTSRELTI